MTILHRFNWVCTLAAVALTLLAFTDRVSGFQNELPDSPMSLSGFSPSQAYELDDNQPLEPNDEFVVRLLYRVGKVSQQNLDRYLRYSDVVTLDQVKEDPRKYRFWVRQVAGEVTSMTKHQLTQADADAGLKGYFEINIQSESGSSRILAREVPQRWLTQSPAGQPVAATGFFLKLQKNENADDPTTVFVANRVQWFPKAPNSELGVTYGHTILALAGFDVGQLDFARQQNTKYFSAADSDCFYQMLAASQKLPGDQFPPTPVGFLDLVQNPTKNFGNRVTLTARVRRCIQIDIDSAYVRKTTGLSHYYELDMFYSLDQQRIVINGGKGEPLEYEDRFPVTVCIGHLPEGLQPGNVENRLVSINGFFYRFWKYQSEFTGEEDGQVSPMIIGHSLDINEPPTQLLDQLLTGVIVVILVVAALMAWFYFRADRKSSLPSSTKDLPDQLELDEIEVDPDAF